MESPRTGLSKSHEIQKLLFVFREMPDRILWNLASLFYTWIRSNMPNRMPNFKEFKPIWADLWAYIYFRLKFHFWLSKKIWSQNTLWPKKIIIKEFFRLLNSSFIWSKLQSCRSCAQWCRCRNSLSCRIDAYNEICIVGVSTKHSIQQQHDNNVWTVWTVSASASWSHSHFSLNNVFTF